MSKYIDLHSIAETVNETNEHEPTNNTQNIVFNKPYCGILHLDKSYGIRGKNMRPTTSMSVIRKSKMSFSCKKNPHI